MKNPFSAIYFSPQTKNGAWGNFPHAPLNTDMVTLFLDDHCTLTLVSMIEIDHFGYAFALWPLASLDAM